VREPLEQNRPEPERSLSRLVEHGSPSRTAARSPAVRRSGLFCGLPLVTALLHDALGVRGSSHSGQDRCGQGKSNCCAHRKPSHWRFLLKLTVAPAVKMWKAPSRFDEVSPTLDVPPPYLLGLPDYKFIEPDLGGLDVQRRHERVQ
jgi:hypothetical protein